MTCPRCGKEEHEAGRETDACIAHLVFGHEFCPIHHGYFCCGRIANSHYSTDIADAWSVVEKMKQKGAAFGIDARWSNICTANFYVPLARDDPRRDDGYGNWEYKGEAETYPLAICRAALEATA